jgi:hypothetical protein
MKKSLFILPLLIGGSLIAQDEQGVFDFTSNYKAKIEEADKINLNPTLVDTIKTEVDLKYSVVPKHVNTDYKPKEIPPVKLKVNAPLKKLKSHYASLGLGLNAYPEIVYGFNLKRNKEHFFSAHVKHFSAKTEVQDYSRNNQMMDNDLSLSYKKFKHKYTFYAGLDYSYDQYALYGIADSVEINTLLPVAGNLSSSYSLGTANMGYVSNYKDSAKVNHQVDLSYINFYDEDNNMEHQVALDGELKKWIDKDLLRVDLNANYYSSFANISEVTTFDVVPTIQRTEGKASVEIGGGLSGNLNDSGSKVLVVPRLNASYQIVNKVLNAFATADGGYDRLSYSSLIAINPFSRFNEGLRTTKTLFDLSVGVRGAFSKRITYKLAYRYSSKENDYLFVANSVFPNALELDVIYDNVKMNQFNAELSHDGEKWKNVLYGEVNTYATEIALAAWHRPAYQIKYNTSYNLQDKIKVGADLYYVGPRKMTPGFLSKSLSAVTVDPFIDLSFHIKYNYNNNLQAFIRLNNVLNNNYLLWQNYPSTGFNFLAGANYKF